MKILITGTPGVGKTTLARALGEKLKIPVINEKRFCASHHLLGKWNAKEKEWGVDIKKLQNELKKFLKGRKDVILEGHLLCEIKLPVDRVMVLRCSLSALEKRLKKKHYSTDKILDNLYCEDTNYCGKKAIQNYGRKQVIELAAPTLRTLISKMKTI